MDAMVQEGPVRVERRLAAILAADVAGYSRLMHHDEEATHAKLTALLADNVTPAIAEHGGRIVKNTGDGFLAEFSSAVEAVRAALQFQSRMKQLTNGEREDRRIVFRVGINIGDVIAEPHDIFGDDVNIAARLESIAEPGGICISSSVYDHVRGKVGIEFADLGEQNLKNIARPVQAYAALTNGPSPATQAHSIVMIPPPRLSIVVLPFANLSGDPEQDYFVDGMTESLTTDLSRISGSFVIGRHTAFTYKGEARDLKKIGRELNVRYLLEGSVQRSDKRLRVNVQLVDAETANHIWAERFDKPMADLFDMQDEVVSRLANALNAELIAAEARRAERSPHPNSLDFYFQGIAWFNKGPTPNHMSQARAMFDRALALDPNNIEAMAWTAAVNLEVASAYMSDDGGALVAAAEAMLVKVLSLAPNHAFAHLLLGSALNATNRAVQCISECERALVLDRNLADAHAEIGLARHLMGQGAETETHISEALRISPRDISAHRWLALVGISKLQILADAEALGWFRRSIELNRNYPLAHFWLATALALLGSLGQANAAAKAGLSLDPSFTVRRFRDGASSDNPTFLARRKRVWEGMRLAGIPEG
jgi:TolB-like protein/class 3 adenylate cyclase/Tfp pilus assembly protein PilF